MQGNQLIKRGLEIIVYANIWVSLGVVALTELTYILLGSQSNAALRYFVFSATLLTYAYARWFDSPARNSKNKSRLTDWAVHNPLLYLIAGVAGLGGSLFFVLQLSRDVWPWLAICALISTLYPLHIWARRHLALREIGGLKLFLIAAVWAIVTTILPAAQSGLPIDLPILLLTLQRFFFIVAITIPFDMRDLPIDNPQMHTLPNVLGLAKARNFALAANFVAELAAVAFYFLHFYGAGALFGQLVAFEITSILIYKSLPQKSDLYYSFWVEGLSVFLFLAVYFFNYFWP